MGRMEVKVSPPLEIDKCPKNHGLWFDDGELQRIASAESADAVAGFLNSILKDKLKKI
jgi:Zn-finger nucleic acid-binding protein